MIQLAIDKWNSVGYGVMTILGMLGCVITLLAHAGFPRIALAASVPCALYGAFWLWFPILEPQDGVDRILKMMKLYPANYQVQLEGCESLYRIAKATTKLEKIKLKVQPNARSRIVEKQGIEYVVQAIETFEGDPDLVARGLAALANLCPPTHKSVLLTEAEFLPFALGAIRRHRRHPLAAKHGLVFICWAADGGKDSKVASLDGQETTPQLIFSIVKIHRADEEVSKWALLALFNLTTQYPKHVVPKLLTDKEGLDAFVSLLKKHHSNPMFQRTGLSLVAFIRKFLGSASGLECIQDSGLDACYLEEVLETYKDDQEMVRLATAVMEGLSLAPTREVLASSSRVELVQEDQTNDIDDNDDVEVKEEDAEGDSGVENTIPPYETTTKALRQRRVRALGETQNVAL